MKETIRQAEHKKRVRKFKRMLNHCIRQTLVCAGHEETMMSAVKSRWRLEAFVEENLK